jgi:hypothetical protein
VEGKPILEKQSVERKALRTWLRGQLQNNPDLNLEEGTSMAEEGPPIRRPLRPMLSISFFAPTLTGSQVVVVDRSRALTVRRSCASS